MNLQLVTRPLHRMCIQSIISASFVMCLGGCFAISIQPTCPVTLAVGESGGVAANEIDPGAIPTYQWTVSPSSAGTFADATSANTTFTAIQSGSATLTLTASDGFFQAISQCITPITGANAVAVSLTANTNPVGINQTVTLTCTSSGTTPATTFTIQQTSGPSISLIQNGDGVVTLTPVVTGAPQFQCIGTSSDNQNSAPATLILTVNETTGSTGGGGGGRR